MATDHGGPMIDPADAPPALFLEQTAVNEVDGEPGTYAGFLSDQWNCPLVPHGGVVTAVALRAMAAALDVPQQRLRSVTSVFVAQVRPGDLRIEVEVLRRGRSMSQVSAQIRNADADEGHRLLAVFGAERLGFEFTELQIPSVPPPEQCRGWRDFPPDIATGPTFNFWQHAESRIAV